MAKAQITDEQREFYKLLCDFAGTRIEDILPKGHIKLCLNKLRWVLTDFGLSHYMLPDMPVLDYIQVAESIAEDITHESVLDVTVFYRILAARNVLFLLKKAYKSNIKVKSFYNTKLEKILTPAMRLDTCKSQTDLPGILQHFSIHHNDSIRKTADIILTNIEPITELSEHKGDVCQIITAGTNKEQNILLAYELFRVIFSLYFARRLPERCSERVLCKKYNTTKFWVDFKGEIIQAIHSCEEGGVADEN